MTPHVAQLNRPIVSALTRKLDGARARAGRNSGASLFLDFARQQYYAQGLGDTFENIITYTRAGEGGRFNALGQYEMVPANTPRLTHDPVTLQPLGILIEEQRTNLLLQSASLVTPWTRASGVTTSTDGQLAPDGTLMQMATVAGTTNHQIEQNLGASLVSGQTYTLSVYLRAKGAAFPFQLGYYDGSVAINAANVTPVVGQTQRFTLTFTPTATATVPRIRLLGFGNGADGQQVYIWGTQLELGASATSYIPTGASQVIRAADVCSVNTLSPWYNALEGTLVVEFARGSIAPSQTFATLRGAFNSTMTLESGSGTPGQLRMRVNDAGTQQAIPIGSNSSAAGVPYKMAGAYAANSFAVAVNGQQAAVASSGTVPTVTRMEIGNVNSVAFINGTIARLTYYPRVIDVQQASA
jgi:hypothetical protein